MSRAAAIEGVMLGMRALLMVALTMTGACSRSNEATCLDRRQRARQAALQDRLDEAERLVREVAAECGPNSQSAVHNIEKTIEERRNRESARRQADEQERELEDRFPSRRFVAWATAHPSGVTGDVVSESCAEPGQPDEGFCEARARSADAMTVRYWKDDRGDAYRYALSTTAPISCRDLVDYRRVREWQVDGSRYELCELTARKLRHLSALLETTPDGNRFLVFSQPYLAHDSELDQLLRKRN